MSDYSAVVNAIVTIVDHEPGLKTTLLPLRIADIDSGLLNFNIVDIMVDLIKQQELVYVGYVLESMDWREKGLLFPKNTKINLNFE